MLERCALDACDHLIDISGSLQEPIMPCTSNAVNFARVAVVLVVWVSKSLLSCSGPDVDGRCVVWKIKMRRLQVGVAFEMTIAPSAST